ncbi:hypothetical protein [Lysobacter sp. N42]|jgi:hypothetical protein|uniref:hypothetical protein n=1 Tax=Lysobacter sp. N42 TaxID=2545719 RepID=UPI001044C5A8|nr:hypothetical protein [Lysobacter sp. N42]TCZ87201.1 hypothetical protein EYQ95_16750 [Lysobacter sp. N42]
MAIARWLAPAALATALGAAALAPVPAKAQSADLVRTIVDIADVVFRGGQPYYRHGDYGYDDRLVAGRDRYGRTVYYRVADPRYGAPPYGRAHGYYGKAPGQRKKCNRSGKCKVEYYDARYDQRRYDDRYYGYGRWRDD